MAISQYSSITASDITTALNGKAPSSHNHDDRYYTETEMDTKLNEKANITDLGLDIEVVWNNSSTTSSFSGQDISISGNYKALIVYYFVSTNLGTGNGVFIFKDFYMNIYSYLHPDNSTYRLFRYRDNVLTISNCISLLTGEIDNNMMIPIIIYGLK